MSKYMIDGTVAPVLGGGGGRMRLFVENACQSIIVGNSSLLVLHRCGLPV